MNRKAFVLGSGTAFPPAFIAIAFIMIVFIASVFIISKFNSPQANEPSKFFSLDKEDLLVQQISSDDSNLFVYEAILLYYKGEIQKEEFFSSLSHVLTSEKDCLFFKDANAGEFRTYRRVNNEFLLKYYSQEFFLPISKSFPLDLEQKEIELQYYWGACPRGLP